jgi:hypothetical protein
MKTWLSWTGALLCVAVFSFGVYRYAVGTAFQKREVLFHDISGHALTMVDGRWYALLVGSVEDDAPIVHALQAETRSRSAAAGPLTSIVLATDTPAVLREYMRRTQPALPIVPVEGNRATMGSALKLEDDRRQILLVNPSREIVFRGSSPKATDVKLLFARFLPSSTREAASVAPLGVGDELLSSASDVVNLGTERRERPATPVLYILFTGRCTTCALTTYMKMTRSVESEIRRHAAKASLTPALVFTSYFSPPRIREQLTALGFTLAAYRVTSEMPGVEELAQRDDADVLAIETDANGRVSRMVPLATFIQELVEVKR